MLTLPPGVRVFVATSRVDGRKGIDGLAALVRSQFLEDPLSGRMYVFFSRRADRVRLLYYDRDGYVLITKRLEKSHYALPMDSRAMVASSSRPPTCSWCSKGSTCADSSTRSANLLTSILVIKCGMKPVGLLTYCGREAASAGGAHPQEVMVLRLACIFVNRIVVELA